ncbi:glycosyltransferase family 2 protein [Petrocella sp. FN5]|uniref:glycosyltransferase family 2 protein n=1 Tax=Petrocella sp. FN5 TaxID=3032002 RepID=UPI0023DAB170|nr:glycosyltransferase [Petrocella sp. FN5]MDF1618115.1 glycosyltransferase [Petrocella sp. FN5]
MGNVLVSIICVAYNHEKYIAEALDSFLMQKTDFDYEILLHDDASTDDTASIIKEYEEKYPDRIKAIYQKENQYSKGIHVFDFYLDIAQGKYIAICEGDDFWIDPDKLQKQTDFMENHPDYSVCAHGAYKINANTSKKVGEVRPSQESRRFTTEEVIIGGGGLFAMNSIFYARKFAVRPDFYYECLIGDFPLLVHLAVSGKVYYIDAFMSAYRVGDANSWTEKMTKSSMDKITHHFDRVEHMLIKVDEHTNKIYTEAIHKKIKKNRFDLLILAGNIEEAKSDEYIEHFQSLSVLKRFKIYIKKYLLTKS